MEGLKKISRISHFSHYFKILLLLLAIACFILVFTGCEALLTETSQQKIDIADASESKSIAPAQEQDTAAVQEETATTEEEPQEEQLMEREIEIKVYYSDEMAEYVVGESRTIIGTTKEDFIVASFKEIMQSPAREDLYNLMPEGTQILDAQYSDREAVLNLSREFVDNKGSQLSDSLLLACIVNTLTEIDGIEGVSFEIEGDKLSVYGTHDLSVPIGRNYSLIKGN